MLLSIKGADAHVAVAADGALADAPLQAFLLRRTLATPKTEILCEVPVSRSPDVGLLFQVNRNFLVNLDGQTLSMLVGHTVDVVFL